MDKLVLLCVFIPDYEKIKVIAVQRPFCQQEVEQILKWIIDDFEN